eukprot:TRINITY_DN16113_c0_g1_i1.p1 TRINITY_DN16113_c0_g1~~TRINITY_DN16113_c0_g1_i1.p1  ORF type:complete len:184 (+),score=64.03 TRINITY_DN16113_c0_g1_i1:31-552(+)
MATSDVKLPEIHAFPPMYTLQPVPETRAKQCELWTSLLLDYCKAQRQWALSVDDAVFANKGINRKMAAGDVQVVLGELVKGGHAEWVKGSKTKCWVFWRTINEWATDIYTYANEEGHIGTVCTVYELSADGVQGKPWAGMPEEMVKAVLTGLEKQGKAEVIEMGDDGDGVKFL